MPIVPNKDGQGIKANGYYGLVEGSYEIPSRNVTGVPTAVATFASEIALDTATGDLYRALATGGTVWIDK
jgi:hypothetical protein